VGTTKGVRRLWSRANRFTMRTTRVFLHYRYLTDRPLIEFRQHFARSPPESAIENSFCHSLLLSLLKELAKSCKFED
jgi:hypothetical protein